MAYTTIDDPTQFFNTIIWSGDSSSPENLTVGFQPDLIWGKLRNIGYAHQLYDSVRGFGNDKDLQPSTNTAEGGGTADQYGYISGTTSTGFTATKGSDGGADGYGYWNESGRTYVAWNWLGGGTAPTKTYTVKVVSDSGNKYRFDDFGTSAVTLDLQEGGTYTFDQSDSSNATHPLRFYTAADKSGGEYTTGVTTTGTAGSSGAKTVITVAASAPTLYYQCSSHSGMGGQANTNSTFGSSNFSGSIQSTVSANTTAGFSIVSWTGTGSAATIGHGLSAVPTMIMVKNRDQADDWYCYNVHNGNTHSILLNSTGAKVGAYTDNWNNTTPTSSVFSVGGSHATSGGSSEKMIAYCFTDIKGYSKLGSYVGTGSDVFVHTGFNVGWLLIKNASDTNGWLLIDTKRSPNNPQGKYIYANANSAEGTVTYGEFFSNGFGWKGTSSVAVNQSGNTFIYYAIAESPFVNSNGVPTNAR